MTSTWTTSAAIAAMLVVSACASGPDPDSFGGRLQAEGGAVAEIGEKWTDGDEAIAKGRALVEDGNDNVDDGESRIAKGRKQVRRGEELIREGERMKREAEEAFRLRSAATAGS